MANWLRCSEAGPSDSQQKWFEVLKGINKNVFVTFFSLVCVISLRADSVWAGAAVKALQQPPCRRHPAQVE